MTRGKKNTFWKKTQLAKFSQKKTAIAKNEKEKEKRAQIIRPNPQSTLPARNQKN